VAPPAQKFVDERPLLSQLWLHRPVPFEWPAAAADGGVSFYLSAVSQLQGCLIIIVEDLEMSFLIQLLLSQKSNK
jgi:hypothetical protein